MGKNWDEQKFLLILFFTTLKNYDDDDVLVVCVCVCGCDISWIKYRWVILILFELGDGFWDGNSYETGVTQKQTKRT